MRLARRILCCGGVHKAVPCTMLSEDEKLVQETSYKFARHEVQPLAAEMDSNGKMDPKLISKCFEAGLMGIETSKDHQGLDAGFFSSILAIEQIARVDPSVSVMVDVQNTLVNNIFFRYASKEQQQQFLPQLATKKLGCFCLTEPESGSDAFALTTKATKEGGSYVINGGKIYITNGGEASIFLIMATIDKSLGYKGITCFVVDSTETPGIEVVRTEKKLGIRASSTAELRFTNVRVPESAVVGEVGKGYKIAIETLNEGRIGIGAQMLGIALGALDVALPYVYSRKQFGKTVGSFQGMQFQIAQAQTELHAARLMVYNAARKKMNGETFVEDAAMAKLYSSQVAERVASRAIEWMGGMGFTIDGRVERFYRDAKIGAIYEGTSNILLQTIAKSIGRQYEQQ